MRRYLGGGTDAGFKRVARDGSIAGGCNDGLRLVSFRWSEGSPEDSASGTLSVSKDVTTVGILVPFPRVPFEVYRRHRRAQEAQRAPAMASEAENFLVLSLPRCFPY